MAEAGPIWERFVACKSLAQPQTAIQILSQQNSSSSNGGGILGARSLNLSSTGSIALNASPETAALMRELTIRPVAELLSEDAAQELASRNRLVDFMRYLLANRKKDAAGHARVQAIAVAGIRAIHSGLVVDKPAQQLQNVLLAELDDISPNHVPTIVDAVLAPLLAASKRRGLVDLGSRHPPPAKGMSETAAAGFLVVLDILPKVLGVTAGVPALSEDAPVPEDVRGLSGAQYKEKVVSRLFRARWPGAVSVGMCQMLRDLALGERQLSVAVSRVLRHLRKNAKLHDLPPLTYQLLLLAGRGCKEAALEGVIQVFDRLDAEAEAADREASSGADGHIPIRRGEGDHRGGGLGANSTEELRFVEGTILLHFNFAMKQDHNLASCVLKGFKRRAAAAEVGRAFTPFRLALLLSLSRIQRFSQPVLDLVQEIVSDCLVYDHLREGSAWLDSEEEVARGRHFGGRGRGGGGGGADGDGCGSDRDGGGSRSGNGGGIGSGVASAAGVVEKVLLTVVASSRGWDHLMESLLKLGLQLLDRGGAGAAGVLSSSGAAGASRGMLEKLQGAQTHRASLRASQLGRAVLMETFKTHEAARARVLAAVLEQVTARSQGVLGYVKLLGLLVERNPNLLLDNAAAVQDVFGYISVLPPPVAERFLVAVAPLLRLRPRLQDSVVLPLRKALFSREERARLVAVGGLVLLLKVQSRKNAAAAAAGASRGGGEGSSHGGTQMSQTSQMSEGQLMMPPLPLGAGSNGGRALSLAEGFGLLRRCLTQQMVVRAKLYDGLLSSFARGSLDIQLDTVSLLVGHLRRFVNLPADGGLAGSASRSADVGAGGAPLLLNVCLGSMGEIVEPLPLLLGCLHRMLVSGRESLAEHTRSGSSSGGGGGADLENILDGDDDVDDAGQMRAGEATAAAAAEALRETLDELDNNLRRLSTALADCPLEEFNLDKVVDFCPNGGLDARKKLATAALLCGSYEALMQGSLLLTVGGGGGGGGDPQPVVLSSSPVGRNLPSPPSVRGLLGLFDCRQTLLSLVRPSLPTVAQQRAKKGSSEAASSGQSSAGFGSLASEGESSGGGGGGGGGGVGGGGGGLPGFSAGGCFGLTLYPGGMPCLGMTFVEDMLAVLNIDKPNEQAVSDDEETEGDTERDPGLIDVDTADGDPPTQAVREDLGLQRLVLETCRGHLRALRTGVAVATGGGGGGSGGGGLAVEIGGAPSAKGIARGVHGGGPQDEADAGRAGKTAAKRCTVLAPLLLKEVFRQLAAGNTSAAAKEARATAKASKGKGKSGSGSGGKGTKKKASGPSESLSELALSCFEECVCITANCSLQTRMAASRTAKMLAAAYDGLPNSNVAPADPATAGAGARGGGSAVASAVLGKYAEGLVQTFISLVGDDQMKEAETVCRILSQLTRLLKLEPRSLEAHGASLKLVCQQQNIKCPILAKAIISLYVQVHMSVKAKGGKIAALHDLATQVGACLGPLDEEEEEEEEDEPPVLTFQVINYTTITAISEVTVGAVQACVDDVEYALRLMQKAALARQARDSAQTPEGLRSSGGLRGAAGDSQSSGTVSEDGLSSSNESCADFGRNSDSDSDAAGIRTDGGVGERDPLDRRETLVCDRLRIVTNALTVLLQSRMEGRFMEKLVSSATRVFRAITKVLKVRLSLKKAYVGAGLKYVLAAKQGFTKALHTLLPKLEDGKVESVTKNIITRQSRLVPALIFQMEECDVQLLLLGKLCKGSLDLPKWVTSRVDRDFRLDQDLVADCQEKRREAREKRKRGSSSKGSGNKKNKKNKDSSSSKNKKKRSGASSRKSNEDEEMEEEEEEEEEQEERTAGGNGGAGRDGSGDDEQEEEEEEEAEEGDDDNDEDGSDEE